MVYLKYQYGCDEHEDEVLFWGDVCKLVWNEGTFVEVIQFNFQDLNKLAINERVSDFYIKENSFYD